MIFKLGVQSSELKQHMATNNATTSIELNTAFTKGIQIDTAIP
jgi:hypothetical protein